MAPGAGAANDQSENRMAARFKVANRLNSFKARPDLFDWRYGVNDIRDIIRRAGTVSGLDAIVFNYPEHFGKTPIEEIKQALAATQLEVRGVNLRYPEPLFLNGAFTNPDPDLRRQAIQLTNAATDACRALGADHVVIWLGNDGFDYSFQMDYGQAWAWELEGIQAVADYAAGMKVSIEYKPAEPRRYSLLRDVGTTLLAVKQCNRPNLGVTLDFCHLLMAGENPATSAALCIHQNLLYGIHLNDGYGQLDDGLMIGSVNLAQTLELIYHVARSTYDDVIYFDTFPIREDPVQECEANIRRLEWMVQVVSALDRNQVQAALRDQDGLQAMKSFWEAIVAP